MQSTHKKSKPIFITIIVVVVGLITAGIFYWNTHKKKFIKDKVEQAVVKKTNGLYNIEYGRLDMDEVTGYLAITNVNLSYDSAKYQALLGGEQIPSILFKLHADSIIATGVKTPKALLDNEIVASTLQIINPVVEIIYTQKGKDSIRTVPDKALYQQILGNLKLMKIDSFKISNAILTTRKISKKTSDVKASHLSFNLNNVLIDSASSKDSSRILFAQRASVQADTISWKSADGLYHFRVVDMAINSFTNLSSIKQFLVDPIYGEEEFMDHSKVQTDRFNFTIKNIQLKGLQLPALFDERLIVENVTTSGSSFKIYRDLNLPHDGKSRIGTYPQQAIMKVKLPLNIQAINLNDCFLEYKEKNALTKMSGKVQFYNMNGTISNLTNMHQLIKKNDRLTVDVRTDFLNVAPFNVKWVMYLMNPNGKFTINATMKGFDGKELNQIIEPMGAAKVESVDIRNLQFEMQGDNYTMKGGLTLLYDNLKVALLKKDDDDNLKKKGLASAVSNLFIKNSNPANGKSARIAIINFTRDTKRSVFSFIWKSIFKAVKETVGIKK
jgi:hypothetical protein